MSGSAEFGRDDLPFDDEDDAPSTDDAVGDGLWGLDAADPFAGTTDWFSAELENVSASDWNIDAAQLWGDGGSAGASEGGLDFPL